MSLFQKKGFFHICETLHKGKQHQKKYENGEERLGVRAWYNNVYIRNGEKTSQSIVDMLLCPHRR